MMKILYVCTHNRCRSILCEAITNSLGCGRLHAKSAGSQPSGEVHPLTLGYLAEAKIPVNGLASKSWNNLNGFEPDVVMTVCDSAAGESCPLWLGDSIKVHWGLEDPSRIEGADDQIAAAFESTIAVITQRVNGLMGVAALPKTEWLGALNHLTKTQA